MKITKCLVASDLNHTYLDFYPLIHKYWNNIVGIPTVLILIANEIPDYMKEYESEIKLFKPIDNIHTAFQSQCIRILYPSLFENENIIISDMDLIPLNKKYYLDNIKNLDESNFVIYRDVISEHKQYPICFCLANSNTWKSIFKIENENDIREKMDIWYNLYNDYTISSAYSLSWACDQLQLYQYVNNWIYQERVIKMKDDETNFKRLDRFDVNETNIDAYKIMIENQIYSDFHLPRPLNQYKHILDKVLL